MPVNQPREKCRQLMATSRLREMNEPAMFTPEIAMQHDEFVRAIAFGVLFSACTLQRRLAKPEIVPPTVILPA